MDRQRSIEDKLFSDHVPSEENSMKGLNQNDDLTSFISQTEVKPIKIVDDEVNSQSDQQLRVKHQKVDWYWNEKIKYNTKIAIKISL